MVVFTLVALGGLAGVCGVHLATLSSTPPAISTSWHGSPPVRTPISAPPLEDLGTGNCAVDLGTEKGNIEVCVVTGMLSNMVEEMRTDGLFMKLVTEEKATEGGRVVHFSLQELDEYTAITTCAWVRRWGWYHCKVVCS